MGVWYMGAFVGSLSAGIIGRYYSMISLAGFYLLVTVVATTNGAVLIAMVPTMRKWVKAGERPVGSGSSGSGDDDESRSLLSAAP